MKTILMFSMIALIGCGDDNETHKTVETVNTNPVHGSCSYDLSGRWYNWQRNRTVCTYSYTCNGTTFNTSYFGNVNCPR